MCVLVLTVYTEVDSNVAGFSEYNEVGEYTIKKLLAITKKI